MIENQLKYPIIDQYLREFYYKKSFKKGGSIKIKKQNKGKFTDYCGGKVTNECIARGKKSASPIIRKRATFADNSKRLFKHK